MDAQSTILQWLTIFGVWFALFLLVLLLLMPYYVWRACRAIERCEKLLQGMRLDVRQASDDVARLANEAERSLSASSAPPQPDAHRAPRSRL